MLTTLNLKVGSILHDMELNIDHRVIYMNKDYFVTILINGIKEKTEINEWHIQTLQHFVNKKQILIENTANDMASVTDNIKYRHAVHCYHADPAYGERFTKAAKLDFNKVLEFAKLSNDDLNKATLTN